MRRSIGTIFFLALAASAGCSPTLVGPFVTEVAPLADGGLSYKRCLGSGGFPGRKHYKCETIKVPPASKPNEAE